MSTKARIYNPRAIKMSAGIAGVRSLQSSLGFLKSLVAYFGKRRVKTIRHSDIERYKLHRLDTPKMLGGQRSIAAVNRELQLMRAILRFAVREGVCPALAV